MIIESMLDNDLYKFPMQQAVLHQFSDVMVEYKFLCRTDGVDFTGLFHKISKEVKNLSCLRFTEDELAYLSSLRFMKTDYVDFLRHFRFDPDRYVQMRMNGKDLELRIKDVEADGPAPWLQVILFEVPILAIISEVYTTSRFGLDPTLHIYGSNNLDKKMELVKKSNLPVRFADFGTRRRASRDWQDYAIRTLRDSLILSNFVGTSNVYFAKKYDLTPIGTMAHEWIQAHQALGYRLVDSQRMAFENWAKEYRGDLGIALSDTLGVDVFLKDFDLYLAKLFDGVRQDSGDPELFVHKMINHYKNLGIDPKSKTIVFSDGLDFDKMLRLYRLSTIEMPLIYGTGIGS